MERGTCWRFMDARNADNTFQAGVEAYERGDFPIALREWRSLAEQSHIVAQSNLGIMYDRGEGIPENDAEAVKWYRKAAEQDNASAQNKLGAMYDKGTGVPEDDVQAYAWFNIAAAQGNELARENKERVDQSMTGEGRVRAQEFARKYWEKYVLPFRN